MALTNDAAGTLTWDIQSDQFWLSSSPASGQGDAAVDVNVDITGLDTGAYSGQLTINSNAQDYDKLLTLDPRMAPAWAGSSPTVRAAT